jgi:hypothetical protein
MSTRNIFAGCLLAVTGLAFSAPDSRTQDRGSYGVQSAEPVQPSQYLSGSGNVRSQQDTGNRGSAEKAGDAVSGNAEARFSTKPAESDRSSDSPEKRRLDSGARRGGPASSGTEFGIAGRGAAPDSPVQDRSPVVR